MKIAIHNSSQGFHSRWIDYCERKEIPFKPVNCYDSNIVRELSDCDALLWHHNHANFTDKRIAKSILFALEHKGLKVFPDFRTGWHFDDKVAQKYLLESVSAPFVPSFVFYTRRSALQWASQTTFPKVFKLASGAGSSNVFLVKDRRHCERLIDKAFGRGYTQYAKWGGLKERYRKYKSGKGDLWDVAKGMIRFIVPSPFVKMQQREKGYAYFQDFIPDNNSDTRVIVVGDKAFALKRLVREGDFRASGSGEIVYERSEINEECVKIAFDVNKRIRSQSIAFDFVFRGDGEPLIVEISYGYAVEAYDPCPGYWDSNLNWHEGQFNPQEWMIENLIEHVRKFRK